MIGLSIWKWTPPVEHLTPRQRLKAFAAERGVTLEQLLSEDRRLPLAVIRQEAMWMLRRNTILSYPQIGRLMNRDHSTIIHGVRQHERRMMQQERVA